MVYSSQSKPLEPLSRKVSFTLIGQITHLFLKLPMNSWSPMRAKTLRQKTVRIITSDSFFTDWMRAPTMVFKPVEKETRLEITPGEGKHAENPNEYSTLE